MLNRMLPYLFLATFAARAETTFNKDVAPIMFQSCAGCHHPGEVAPFSLLTFQDASKRSKQIVKVTQQKFMPPWKAEPGFGDFSGCRSLTAAQIATIKKWADEGCIEGRTADLPKAPTFPEGWQLGKPDMVIKMPVAYKVPAEGKDIYRCFVLPIDIPEDKFVTAVEYHPGNRAVVHHAILFLDNKKSARVKDGKDGQPGYTSFAGPGFIPSGSLGGWAPGAFAHPLPDGVAIPLKKGSDLVLQTHFHPSGKEETELSSVAIYFSKTPPKKVLAAPALWISKLDIPAGEKAHKLSDEFTLPIDMDLIGVTPHAHLLCKEIKAVATLPNGTTQPVIWVKDWDFDWQDQYQYKTPVHLPKGTKLSVDFTYDNSSDNIRNPSEPPKRVHLGEQTTDEMGILFLQGVVANQAEVAELLRAQMTHGIESAKSAITSEIEGVKKRAEANGGKLTDEDKARVESFVKQFLDQQKK
jgi:hypothetical protein